MCIWSDVFAVSTCVLCQCLSWVLIRHMRVWSHIVATLWWFDLLLKHCGSQSTAWQGDLLVCNRAIWDPTWSPQFGQSAKVPEAKLGADSLLHTNPLSQLLIKDTEQGPSICATLSGASWWKIAAICPQLPSLTTFGNVRPCKLCVDKLDSPSLNCIQTAQILANLPSPMHKTYLCTYKQILFEPWNFSSVQS